METRRVCKGISSLTLLYVSTQCVDDTTLVRQSIFQLLPGIKCRVFHRAEQVIRKVDLWSRWRPCLFYVSSPVALCINSLPSCDSKQHTHMHTSTQTHTLIITPNTSRSVNSCRRRQRGVFHDRISSSSSSSAPLRLS